MDELSTVLPYMQEDRERMVIRKFKFEDPRIEQIQDLESDMISFHGFGDLSETIKVRGDVYTYDSGLVAVLMHTGYCCSTASPPPTAIQELRATIRVLQISPDVV
ncbi:hypothetical protein HN51_036386 [Arachis hypogaea]